jgi:hypothetical protein
MDAGQWAVVIVIIAAMLAASAAGYWWVRRRQSDRLRQQVGPENDQAVSEYGGADKAEAAPRQRTERVAKLDIRRLSASERERFEAAWNHAQRQWIDDPSGGVATADELVQELMAARGYPTVDFEQRAADISVDHPDLVRNYREAHSLSIASREGRVGTDGLRTGFVRYRELFTELLESDSYGRSDGERTRM